MGLQDFWLFVVAGLMLNMSPGPDFALITASASKYGLRSGIAAALGISAGSIVHVTFAALGLSAILVSSSIGFTAVKWGGAVYLCFLGWQMLREKKGPAAVVQDSTPQSEGFAQSFTKGFVINLLNPKVAIFFLAFLPQFIDPAYAPKAVPFLILGLTFNVTGTLWNIGVAVAAVRVLNARSFKGAKRAIGKLIGGTFIVLGIKLAFTKEA